MEALEYLIISRSIERISAILLGGGAIYWAYRIFLNLPNISTVEDNFKFKKYIYFHSVKIGAGTVFLIFGAYIVLISFLKPVTLTQGPEEASSGRYSGVGEEINQKNYRENEILDFNNIPSYFSTLNQISQLLSPDIDGRDLRDVQITISRIKLNLMLAIWKSEEWGDKISFREWVIGGANGPKPESVDQRATDLFHHTQ